MKSDRRQFLATGAAGLAAAATFSTATSTAVAKDHFKANVEKAKLRISSQFRPIPGKTDEDKMAQMAKWGIEAVEPWRNVVGKEKEFKKAADNAGLAVSVVCYGSTNGDVVSDVVEKRAGGIDNVKRAIEAAGTLGARGVIFVPAFNGQTKLNCQEIRKILVDDALPKLGEFAVGHNTTVILEPLNRKETFFLRQIADAASIARDANSPGVCVMGDFYHMTIEETSDMGAFISGGDRVRHVHLAGRIRKLPGQDDKRFVDGFRGLKMIGYDGYCSFECGVKGKKEIEVPKAIQFLRDQWSEADV
ncbi:MAG: sugar phosphate isomerase/epimerase family protein [Planctomycetia bacterium]|jgi:sugar phosphate isomerase/epimerase